MNRLIVFTAIVLIIVSACRPSQPKLAVQKLALAESLIARGDTAAGLTHLDSIPVLYPRALSEGRNAIQLSNKIIVSQLMQQRDNLAMATTLIDSLITQFTPETGEFDKNTYYIYNGTGNTWSRTFLHVYLTDKGNLLLVSNYYGSQWINHTSVSIEAEAVVAKTDSVPPEHLNNHHGEFGGAKWEKVTYRGPQAEQVIALIAKNTDKKIKVVFNGKPTSTTWVEDRDKKAIKAAYEFSQALKVKAAATKQISVLEKKIKSEEE